MMNKPTYAELEKRVAELERQVEQFQSQAVKYRTLFDSFPHGITVSDMNGNIIETNKAAIEFLGYEKDELVGSLFLKIYAEESINDAKRLFEAFKVSGKIRNREMVIQGKNGSKRWVLLNVDSVKDDKGHIIHSAAIQVDITDRKFAEQVLKESEENLKIYRNIISSTTDAIAYLDEKYRYIIVNNAYAIFSGINRDRFVGLTVSEYLGEKVFEQHIKPNFDRCLKGEIVNFQEWFDYPTIGKRYVDVTYYPYRDEKNHISGIIANTRDITESKYALESLRESEQKFRSLVEQAAEMFFLHDLNGNFIDVNPATAKNTGYSSEELKKMSIFDIDRDVRNMGDIQHYWEGLKPGDSSVIFELKHTRKDGSVYPAEVVVSKIVLQGNNYILGLARNISERKQAEKDLRRSEKKHRNILKTAMEGFWINDNSGRLIEVNNAYCQMSGYSKEELLTMFVWDVEAIDDQNKLLRHARAVIENGEDRFESIHRRKDGTHFNVEVSVQYSSTDGGQFIVFLKDITDWVKAKESLMESEKRFRDLADFLPEAIFEADINLNLTFANQKAFEITGYNKKDFEKGLNGFDILVPADRARAKENAAKRIKGEGTGATEYTGLKKDGTTFPILLHTSPILSKGKTVGIRGIIVDISDRKRFENQLRQAQKMESIGNLAGGIAHDFNNILFPIIGMSEILIEDLSPKSPQRENAIEIFKAGKRGRDLVKQILAFSRQAEHKMIPTRIQNVLKEALQLSRASIPSYIEIRQDIQSDCGLIMADPAQIHQVVMNIITNAFHALEAKGGTISVRLRETILDDADSTHSGMEAGKYAVLSVSDTGHGMPEELIGKIFDPYFTTKEQGKGTGLGLAVVHGIIKEHGGYIKVNSEIGRGSSFDVYLPLMERLYKDRSIVEAEAYHGGDERILLVDDESSIASLEKQMLERLGYQVTMRTNSRETLEAFSANPNSYDLILSDMTMPDITGDQLANKIRSIRPDIPVIICTGFSERIDEEKAKTLGIDGLLIKPVTRSDLAKTVRRVLDQAKSGGQQ